MKARARTPHGPRAPRHRLAACLPALLLALSSQPSRADIFVDDEPPRLIPEIKGEVFR